jgi:hypothetical protein
VNEACRVVVGRHGDDILMCACGDVLGIRLKVGPLVITRLATRVFVPCPEGVQVGCPKCRKEWAYENGVMRLKSERG